MRRFERQRWSPSGNFRGLQSKRALIRLIHLTLIHRSWIFLESVQLLILLLAVAPLQSEIHSLILTIFLSRNFAISCFSRKKEECGPLRIYPRSGRNLRRNRLYDCLLIFLETKEDI